MVTTHPSLSSIIDDIRNIIVEEARIRWSKVPRENNKVADCLARNSLSLNCNFMFYDFAPAFIHLVHPGG